MYKPRIAVANLGQMDSDGLQGMVLTKMPYMQFANAQTLA